MKRIVFIGKNRYKKRICVFLIGVFAFYVLFFSFKIVTLDDISVYFHRKMGDMLYRLAVNATEETYEALSYKRYCLNKRSAADAFIDNINHSISYYGYVENSAKPVKLVVYDPNRLPDGKKPDMEENGETAETVVQTADTGEKETEAAGGQSEVPVSVGASGIMKLQGAGTGKLYSLESLSDFNFLLSSLYVVPGRAAVLDSELNAPELLGMDMSIKKNAEVPQILIYHTHSMEGFTDSINGNFDTNIVSVGTYLAKLLSDGYGYNVIHCTESFDYVDGVLDRSKAYTYARTSLEQILADNPSIEVVLDIHRDGVNENMHLISEVNGKKTSQIMFFNGVSRTSAGGDIDYLYNKYKKQNLAFSLQLKLLAEQYFPGFTRKNYIDAYQYNLDLRERSVLVEVGAQTNSLSEAKNAMEPLAALLDRILSGDDEIY